MRIVVRLGSWVGAILAPWGLFGCGSGSDTRLPFGEGVPRDAWIDQAETLPGDEATEFVSGAPLTDGLSIPLEVHPFYFDAPSAAPSALDGERLYVLSGYAGLVIADVSDPAAPVSLGRLPLAGVPGEISARGGMVLALVSEEPCCYPSQPSPYVVGGESRALLIDARDPSAPVIVAEHLLPGSIAAAQRVGDVAYVVSRDLDDSCYECSRPAELGARVTALSLSDPLAISEIEQLDLPATPPVGSGAIGARDYRFLDGRLFVATEGGSLQVVELQDGLRLGPSAPFQGASLELTSLGSGTVIVAGHPYSSYGPAPSAELERWVSTPGALAPVDTTASGAPEGAPLELEWNAAAAVALSADRRSLQVFAATEPAAPRFAGALALPFEARLMVAAGPAQVLALGPIPSAAGWSRVALIDVSIPAEPRITSELDWQLGPEPLTLGGEPRYDAGSETLLLPYRDSEGEPGLQVFGVGLGQLSLGASAESTDTARIIIDGTRLYETSFTRIAARLLAAGAAPATLTIAYPAAAVRVLGGALARVGGASTVDVVAAGNDVLGVSGTDVSGLVEAASNDGWQRRVLGRESWMYLLKATPREKPVVFAFDVTDPARVSAVGSAELWGLSEDYRDALLTNRSIVVPRTSAWLPSFPPNDVPPPWMVATNERYYGFDVVDIGDPAAPRVATHVALPPALASGMYGVGPHFTSVDTPWGWQSNQGPLVSGDLVVSQHGEPTPSGGYRFFLDRLDVSQPDAPRSLPRVSIPGQVLAFDSRSGSLLTLDYLSHERAARRPSDCATNAYQSLYYPQDGRCEVTWRSLSGLSVAGNVASRKSQLLLDDTRRTARFAVSGDQVFYVTEPRDAGLTEATEPSSADLRVTLERVRVDAGELTRWPSLDITELHGVMPRQWQQMYARGQRVYILAGRELGVVDFGVTPPRATRHALPRTGCSAFDVAGDRAYCATGESGVFTIDLAAVP